MEGADQFSAAGFVFASGCGSRLRREKALLELEDTMLVERIAERIRRAAGNVTWKVASEISDGIRSLCAVYHRRTLPASGHVIDHKCFKMPGFPKTSRAVSRPVADSAILPCDSTPAQNAGVPGGWTGR